MTFLEIALVTFDMQCFLESQCYEMPALCNHSKIKMHVLCGNTMSMTHICDNNSAFMSLYACDVDSVENI
jgi:hypothetical protein